MAYPSEPVSASSNSEHPASSIEVELSRYSVTDSSTTVRLDACVAQGCGIADLSRRKPLCGSEIGSFSKLRHLAVPPFPSANNQVHKQEKHVIIRGRTTGRAP